MNKNSWVLDRFHVIEGIDGAGKTTVLNALKDICKVCNKNILATKEPTDSVAGKMARLVMQLGEHDQTLLAYLFAADREDHVYGKNGFLDMIRYDGSLHVFSDRYFFSNMVYQNMAGDIEDDLTGRLNANFPFPKTLFFLDVDPEEAAARQEKRGDVPDHIKGLIARRNAYNYLLELMDKTGPRGMKIVRLDAKENPTYIARQIFDEVFGDGCS